MNQPTLSAGWSAAMAPAAQRLSQPGILLDATIGRRAGQPIKVLLVDDHPVVRKGLTSYMSHDNRVKVVGEAADGREAVRKARELRPDVVLMDIDMPFMSGLTAAELLRRELPSLKVLVLTMHNKNEYVLRMIQAGACGYLLKDAGPDEVISAILKVHAGEACYSGEVARIALNQFVRGAGTGPAPSLLTLREREVLIQIAEGLSNKEIASFLQVGVRTVETHRERIMKKLDIHSAAGLTRFAITKGMVSVHADIHS